MDLHPVLSSLANTRPLFHSEADFQHALAWEIQRSHQDAKVRLEVPLMGLAGRAALDVVVIHEDVVTAVELKYFRSVLTYAHNGEGFRLRGTVARDIARYDACKDIARLEHALASGQANEGFLITLSNDRGFWSLSSKEGTVDEQFKIHDGRILVGELGWSERAGAGTTKGRETTIRLCGSYSLQWRDYVVLPEARPGTFRYLLVDVQAGEAKEVLEAEGAAKNPSFQVDRRIGRYDALRQIFRDSNRDLIELTLDEIEDIVGALPPSARRYVAWWHHSASHPHAVWELEGYKASPRLAEGRVTFKRR